MAPILYVHPDLAWARLIGSDAVSEWVAPPRGTEESEETLATVRARVASLCTWAQAELRSMRRAPLVVIDTEDARCLWLRARSAEPAAISAALQSASQDWGGLLHQGSIEALRSPSPETNGAGAKKEATGLKGIIERLNKPINKPSGDAPSAVASAVVHLPDSIVRMLLDELDRRGVRTGKIVSLWHAITSAWSPEGSASVPTGENGFTETMPIDTQSATTTAVVIMEEHRLVWTWAYSGRLIAGGQTVIAPAPEKDQGDWAKASASRLAIDWLTWAGQLGRMPESVRFVGTAPASLVRAAREHWPQAGFESIPSPEPLGETLKRAQESDFFVGAPTPTRCLTGLTTRATRKDRQRFRWMAASLTSLAVALGLLGHRLRESGESIVGQAQTIRAEADDRTMALDLEVPPNIRDMRKWLESEIMATQTDEPAEFPAEPKPVFREVELLLGVLEEYAEDARILMLTIDDTRESMLRIQLDDQVKRIDLGLAIEQLDSDILWQTTGRTPPPGQLQLSGRWVR